MEQICRRFFIAGTLSWLLNQPANAQQDPGDRALIDDWMQKWMGEAKASIGTLHLSRFADRVYFTTKPIVWEPDPGLQDKYPVVNVPAGFVTDFASIPRVFWTLLPPDDVYTYPAIIHDYLYWQQTVERDKANDILDIGMKEFGVSTATRIAISAAVKTFGHFAWESNRKLILSGEKRELVNYPTSPLTRWAEWKQVPKNFR